jgi:hypothetical protein
MPFICRFMENLQTEVLELEFHEFSKGHDTITEVDFAKILLRYTHLDTDEYAHYNNYCMTSSLFDNSLSSAHLDVIQRFVYRQALYIR